MEKARPFFVGFLALAVLFLAYVALKRPNEPEYASSHEAPTANETESRDPSRPPGQDPLPDAAVPTRNVMSVKEREDLKKKIYGALWAESGKVPSRSEIERAPPSAAPLSPAYVQSRIREDFKPMAAKCYEELLSRHPDAGGTEVMEFTIVADEKLGGIVEETNLGDGGTMVDPSFSTCMRESLSTVAFAPPPKGGKTTVHYPFSFSPGDDEPTPKR